MLLPGAVPRGGQPGAAVGGGVGAGGGGVRTGTRLAVQGLALGRKPRADIRQ